MFNAVFSSSDSNDLCLYSCVPRDSTFRKFSTIFLMLLSTDILLADMFMDALRPPIRTQLSFVLSATGSFFVRS